MPAHTFLDDSGKPFGADNGAAFKIRIKPLWVQHWEGEGINAPIQHVKCMSNLLKRVRGSGVKRGGYAYGLVLLIRR